MIYHSIKGERIPALGFGTYHLRGPEGIKAIRYALDVGYRHLDTAIRYENEVEVGRAIAESGIDRSAIFLTTKLRYADLARDDVRRRTAESLGRLRTDHVDLLLAHWPNATIALAETMAALAEVRAAGQARHIGISNFPTSLMRQAIEDCGADIFTNQVEYHPFLRQNAVLDYVRARGILLTAAVPLARGAVADEPLLQEIAACQGKSPAQITLRWLVQQPHVAAIPKSSRPERIRANFEIFDFALSADETTAISALGANQRLVNPKWAPAWDAV
ncbi:MAG: aldo/keto reductase [Geminicoccaceae bacterium]